MVSENLNRRAVLATVRQAVADRLYYQADHIVARFHRPQDTDSLVDVHVQFWLRGEVRAAGVALRRPLYEAAYQATIYALDISITEGRIARPELNELTIEVAVKTWQRELEPPYAWDEPHSLDDYKHGLRLETKETAFDIFPSQIIREQRKTLRQQLAPLLEKAAIAFCLLQERQCKLLETHWCHIAGGLQGEALALQRHRVIQPLILSRPSILQAAQACGTRLLNTQAVDGSYLYTYQALQDRKSNDNYNVVRLAGTAFAIAMLAEKSYGSAVRQQYIGSVHACLSYLFYLGRTTPHIAGGMYIAQEAFGLNAGIGKLGTTALTLLALQFGEFFHIYAKQRQALIRSLLFMQREDGAFNTYMPTHRYCPNPGFRLASQSYFPGEALLALCYELEHGYREDIATSIARAFHYYQRHFEQRPETAFVLWQVSTWAKFHELMLDNAALRAVAAHHALQPQDVAAFVYRQADWIGSYQYTEEATTVAEFVGGFPNNRVPHSVSSCYVEALIRAAGLAMKSGDSERLARYRLAAVNGLRFLRRLQIKDEEAFMFPDPAKACGGISGTLTSFQLRNDRDQHAITAYLAALECPVLFEEAVLPQGEPMGACV